MTSTKRETYEIATIVRLLVVAVNLLNVETLPVFYAVYKKKIAFS